VPFTSVYNSYDLPRAERRRIAAIANPFDRYAEALCAYFPDDNPLWSNYRKLLPQETAT